VNGAEPSTVSHILQQAQQWKGGVGSIVFVINKTLSTDITSLATSVQ
jgi:hypothetical protein